MTDTIRIACKLSHGWKLFADNNQVLLKGGNDINAVNGIGFTDIEFSAWMKIKENYKYLDPMIKGFVYPENPNDEILLYDQLKKQLLDDFETTGESEVRILLTSGKITDEFKQSLATEWLRVKESTKRDKREEETLSIARSALSTAKEANRIASEGVTEAHRQARWAMWAAIIAVVERSRSRGGKSKKQCITPVGVQSRTLTTKRSVP